MIRKVSKNHLDQDIRLTQKTWISVTEAMGYCCAPGREDTSM